MNALLLGCPSILKKTKAMVTKDNKILLSLNTSESLIGQVLQFKYIGTLVTSSSNFSAEVQRRIGLAAANFNALRKLVWRQRQLPPAVKLIAFLGYVVSVLLYGSEAWSPTVSDVHDLQTFYHRCLRTMYGAKWEDRISNICLRAALRAPSLNALLRQRAVSAGLDTSFGWVTTVFQK